MSSESDVLCKLNNHLWKLWDRRICFLSSFNYLPSLIRMISSFLFLMIPKYVSSMLLSNSISWVFYRLQRVKDKLCSIIEYARRRKFIRGWLYLYWSTYSSSSLNSNGLNLLSIMIWGFRCLWCHNMDIPSIRIFYIGNEDLGGVIITFLCKS